MDGQVMNYCALYFDAMIGMAISIVTYIPKNVTANQTKTTAKLNA